MTNITPTKPTMAEQIQTEARALRSKPIPPLIEPTPTLKGSSAPTAFEATVAHQSTHDALAKMKEISQQSTKPAASAVLKAYMESQLRT